MLDTHEQQDLKEFLVALFGNQAQGWPMNEGVFNLTYELVQESSSCSDLMDLVPSPHAYFSNPMSWMKKQAREIFLRALKDRKDHYVICLKASAVKMVRQFQMAAAGV